MKNEGPMNTSQRTVSDEALQAEWLEIQAAQADPALFRPLYNRYFEQIFQFIYYRILDEDTCADLCSQVFLKAMQRLKDYTFKGVPFSAWLFRIATNEVAQFYRQNKRVRVVSADDSHLAELFEEMEKDRLEPYRSFLVPSLEELSSADLEIVELRFFEQRPFREIAEIFNITESNAKMRTYRALERLKKILLSKANGKGEEPFF